MASHLIGILAFSLLSPVVVAYTFLTLGAVAIALLGGGVDKEGSVVQNVVFAALAVGDGALIDWMWRRDLSFEQNAFRLFGGLGLILWLADLVWARIRPGPPPRDEGAWARFKTSYRRLAVFTLVLSLVILAGLIAAGPGGDEYEPAWSLRAALTAFGMGASVLIFTTPSYVAWSAVNAMRGPVSGIIAGVRPFQAAPPESPATDGREDP